MSLQFIFGNSGSGKSRYLYEQVIAGACENPNRNYIVLVPDDADTERISQTASAAWNHEY